MNLYLIRHGEIGKKYIGRYMGSTDVGLSHEGKKQAKKLGDFFTTIPVDYVYISNKKRALQTAAPLLKKKKIQHIIDARLAEIDLGDWEGKTSRQVKKMLPKNISCDTNAAGTAITSGGELYTDFSQRVADFLIDIKKKHKVDTVVVVTHKGVIRDLYKLLLADPDIIVDQEYGAINQFVIDGKRVTEKMRNKLV